MLEDAFNLANVKRFNFCFFDLQRFYLPPNIVPLQIFYLLFLFLKIYTVMKFSDLTSENSLFSLVISNIEESHFEVLKITLSDARSFYTRSVYLREELFIGDEFSESVVENLFVATRCYLAECKAMRLLNYADNSRFMLEVKLTKKGFTKSEISPALDYLEEKAFLSDRRFAESWLRSRLRLKAEAPFVLQAGLMARGISAKLASEVLRTFLNETSETEICNLALAKELKKTKDKEKVFSRLQKLGFSYSVIKKVWVETSKTDATKPKRGASSKDA